MQEHGQLTDGSEAALDQSLGLLRTKDDTSRFVGLSLLRSVLDTNADLRTDPRTVTRCWEAISPRFLVRLLRSHASERCSEEEAKGLVELAIAVIHTFVNLLPTQVVDSESVAQFCGPLVQRLPSIGPASVEIALQALEVLASTQHGAGSLLAREDPQWIVAASQAGQDHLRELGRVLRAMQLADPSPHSRSRWDTVFARFLDTSEGAERQNLLETLAEILSDARLHETAKWLPRVIDIIRQAILSKPTLGVRQASISLAASLLQHSDGSLNVPQLLFSAQQSQAASTTFAYFFTNLVLIEIRSTIPSLMEQLASPNYSRTALHLGSCFDILSNFIVYLMQSMVEDDEIVEGQKGRAEIPLTLPPDQLLKLRSAITETFSMTLEYLRDRWDAAVTGARGLDPSTYGIDRSPEVANTPRALAWDNPTVSPEDDPVFLSSLRAMALWIREDDNPKLQEQAVTNMDIILALYAASTGRGDGRKTSADFRQPALILLAALLSGSEAAVQQFLEQDGWRLLAEDLEKVSSESGPVQQPYTQDVIRCLLAVVESTFVPQSRESWMPLGGMMSKLWPVNISDEQLLDDVVAGFQLAVALVLKAPKRLKKQFKQDWQTIQRHAELMLLASQSRAQRLSTGVRDGLVEVVDGLDSLQEA